MRMKNKNSLNFCAFFFFFEIASVVNSIQPCSSLVEGMFSITSRKYNKNCTIQTLETNTLNTLYRRMSMRFFIFD